MRCKLAISALVVASLFGATAIASAQTQQSAPGASGEGNAGTTTMAPGKMKSSNKKQGTTTGMAPEGMKPGSVDGRHPGFFFSTGHPAGSTS